MRYELRRMQVPALKESMFEGPPHIVAVQLPCAMNHSAVLRRERRCQGRAAMKGYRHDGGRSVGHPDSGSRDRSLHHLPGEYTSGMVQVLNRGADAQARAVIVRTEVHRRAAPARLA